MQCALGQKDCQLSSTGIAATACSNLDWSSVINKTVCPNYLVEIFVTEIHLVIQHINSQEAE